jgi:nucleotide-binding universal stress UspA family protein
MPRFHTVVAAVDFSSTSADVLAAACEMARGNHGHVHLIHVVPDPLQFQHTVEPVGLDLAAALREWTANAENQLTELATRQQPQPEFLTIATPSGNPVTRILDYASEHDADAIVLGSHGRGFVDRLLLGNVPARVLRRSFCTVVVVPHRTHQPTTFEVRAAASVES